MQNNKLTDSYDECVRKGFIIHLEGVPRIKLESAILQLKLESEDLELISNINYSTPLIIFNAHYDVLHKSIQTFLLFNNIKSYNHECLFTYLCSKHPELKLEWKFLDGIRKKRNNLHYYNGTINFEEWTVIEYEMKRYIRLLISEIENKLKNP